ncbi:MAG: arabinose operon transcriptional regulator AraC [Methylobacteriaceae bacterium]|jgi:AraC family transcriptional regulator of arabinose operon|nr:arabinose operon transcriptional regulator AraC [Methylobacteriaceae bacterium]
MKRVVRKETQPNPLLPGYDFNAHLVAGTSPILKGGFLDFWIDRPNGMKGYIINLTVKGRGVIHEDGAVETCKPGDLVLFPPSVMHYYGRDPDYSEWIHAWIYFRPRAYWSQWLDWPQKIKRIGRLTLPDEKTFKEFLAAFREIEYIHRRSSPLSEAICINLLERLLLRCADEIIPGSYAAVDTRIMRACYIINEHLFENFPVSEVAREVCLSTSRLAHLFREQMGISITKWREDQRLIHAQQLLKITQSPIAAVAALVGYSDQLYFSRVFRKSMGISPLEYRRRNPSETQTPGSDVSWSNPPRALRG